MFENMSPHGLAGGRDASAKAIEGEQDILERLRERARLRREYRSAWRSLPWIRKRDYFRSAAIYLQAGQVLPVGRDAVARAAIRERALTLFIAEQSVQNRV